MSFTSTRRSSLLPMLLLTLFLLDVASFSSAKATFSTHGIFNSNKLNLIKGGSLNLESATAVLEKGNSTNGPTTSIDTIVLGNDCGMNNTDNLMTSQQHHNVNSHIELPQYHNQQREEVVENDSVTEKKLKVLFLSADTGGGHRASAESLANQLMKLHPNVEYELCDVWTPTNVFPYKTLVPTYKHMSAHPRQWRLLYYLSNTKLHEKLTDIHSYMTCYEKIEAQLESYDPDIVISVHPTMNQVPNLAIRNISKKKGVYIPFFTVVTDFGSGHCSWFQGNPDMIYVASEPILKLAKRRGGHTDEKIVMSGLPIRDDFSVQAEKMGDRTTVPGKAYRQLMKEQLGLIPTKKIVLLMGGGEGVGSLARIAEKLRKQLKNDGVDATILVICGRNEKLKNELNERDWDAFDKYKLEKKKRQKIRTMISNYIKNKKQSSSDESTKVEGDVDVIGLGFITNMAEYMVAADILVSKAGPGTIAEAAAVGLPVMITSFLPGQEAGNVDIVLDGKFGAFSKKPKKIANIISSWLQDERQLDEMSRGSRAAGNPSAASEIVQDIIRQSLEKIKNNKH